MSAILSHPRTRWPIIVFLLILCLSSRAEVYSFWDSLALIESGMRDNAVGRDGEVSRYQLLPKVWSQYSKSKRYSDDRLAQAVANQHAEWLRIQFRKAARREASEADLIIMWKIGFAGFRRLNFDASRISAASADRVERFLNLRSLSKNTKL